MSHPTSHRTIVFDLDGTLIDTAPDLIDSLNALLGRERLAEIPYDEARSMIGGGVRPLLERALAYDKRTFTPAHVDALFRDYVAHYAEHIADRSRPFPGLLAALDALDRRGDRLAVCTNKLEWLSRRLLDALGLTARFATICGQDTYGVMKPDPEVLRRTIAAAGGTLAGAVMVGDSVTDIAVAKAAGVPVVAVDFGYTDVPVSELGPDRVISHFDALPAAIDALTADPR